MLTNCDRNCQAHPHVLCQSGKHNHRLLKKLLIKYFLSKIHFLCCLPLAWFCWLWFETREEFKLLHLKCQNTVNESARLFQWSKMKIKSICFNIIKSMRWRKLYKCDQNKIKSSPCVRSEQFKFIFKVTHTSLDKRFNKIKYILEWRE